MLSQDVVRRLTVIASDTGLTTLKGKLDAVDHAQDRVAASGARMGAATDDLQKRIAAYTAQATKFATSAASSAAGGVAGQFGADALRVITRFAPAALAAYAGFKLLNEAVGQGAALMEKYGLAGQRTMFGEGVDKGLESLTKFQNDTATQQQMKYAADLSGRLEQAKYTIGQVLKVQMDLGDAGLRFQNVWVAINELTAKVLITMSTMPEQFARMGNAPWIKTLNDFMERQGWNSTPESMGIGVAADPTTPAAVSREEALRLARGRLAAGMGQNVVQRQLAVEGRDDDVAKGVLNASSGTSFTSRFQYAIGALEKKPDDSAPKIERARLDEYERAMKSIQKQTEALEIQAKTFGQTTEQAARYKIEQELINAATLAGKTLTDEDSAAIEQKADAYAAAAVQLDNLREKQRTLNELSDTFRDASSGFAHDMNNKATATEAFSNALGRIKDRLMDMAINKLWDAAFPKKGGGLFSVGGTGGLLGGSIIPGILHDGGLGMHAPSSGRYVHPAYFDNAPRFHEGKRPWGPGEMPAIIRPEEEVLTTSDPRHRWNGGGGTAGGDTYVSNDNRVFNDVTPDVMAKIEARLRMERPKIVQETLAEMRRQRGKNPNLYAAG